MLSSFFLASLSPPPPPPYPPPNPYRGYEGRVRAGTAVGLGPAAVVQARTLPAEPASGPSSVSAGPASAEALLVQWDDIAAVDQNGVVQGYTVTVRLVQPPTVVAVVNATGNNVTVDGLNPYTDYVVSVAGFNSVGFSPAVNAQGRTGESTPTAAPASLAVNGTSRHEARLSWRAPAASDLRGVLLGYFLFVRRAAESDWMYGNTPDTWRVVRVAAMSNGTVDQLEADRVYEFKVAAFTSAGAGPNSSVVTARTPEGLPTAAPRSVEAASISSTAINVSFAAPLARDWHGQLVGYRVRYKQPAADFCQGIVCPPPGPCFVTGTCVDGVCLPRNGPNFEACDDQDNTTVNDQCFEGVCRGTPAAGHAVAAVHARTMQMDTRSHGGGFSPQNMMYVYPQWSGTSTYVYDLDGVYQRSFTSDGYSSVMQMWFEPTGGVYYTANWDNNRCQKIGGYPSAVSRVWTSPNLGYRVGGVTADADYVYCFAHDTGGGYAVLDKNTGQLVENRFLSLGSLGPTWGAVALVETGGVKKLYYGSSRDLYRFDMPSGRFDGFHNTTDVNMYNLAFNGLELAISSNNDIVYFYRVLTDNIYRPATVAQLVTTPYVARTMSVSTRSYASGYYIPHHEYWFPQWAGSTVYRHTRGLSSLETVQLSVSSITQLWSQTDGNIYVSSADDRSVTKFSRYPELRQLWRQPLGVAMGGVACDVQCDVVYAMPQVGNKVFVLDAGTGAQQRTLTLDAPASDSFTGLYGGLVVAQGLLFHVDATNTLAHRYVLPTGKFDDVAFSLVGGNVYNGLFDGQDWCVSPASSTVTCHRLFTASVYGAQAGAAAELALFGNQSNLLSPQQDRQLSAALSRPGHAADWRRCFSARQDGFSASVFHRQCDNKGATVTIARVTTGGVKGRLFGGYATTAWTSRGGYVSAPESFLFRFAPDFQRTDSAYSNSNHMYDQASRCPAFGSGHDLNLDSQCRSGSSSPNTYRLQSGFSDTWLTGNRDFTVDDVEVFYVNDTLDLCTSVACSPSDQCHAAGECLHGGLCTNPALPDGTLCDDGNAATVGDACLGGMCAGVANLSTNLYQVIDALEEDTDFEFTAQAFTRVGPGPWSRAVTARTQTAPPSGAPRNVAARAPAREPTLQDVSLDVTWDPPEQVHQNGVLLGYTVYYQTANDTTPQVGGTGLFLSFRLQGLQPFTRYRVWVVAFNAKGAGPASAEVQVVTNEGLPVAPPTDLSSLAVTAWTVALKWGPVPAGQLHGTLQQYSVAMRLDDSTPWGLGSLAYADIAGTSATEQTLTNVSPDTTYRIKVRALTKRGPGPYSLPIVVRTLAAAPASAPVNLTARSLDAHRVQTAWAPPARETRYGNITLYEVALQRRTPTRLSCDLQTCALKGQCWRWAAEPCRDGQCGRQEPLNGTACDDGNVLTLDDVCLNGTCAGWQLPRAVNLSIEARRQLDTRSHGGGYMPAPVDEWWYPQWSGSTIYRYTRSGTYVDSFSTSESNIMSLAGAPDGSGYYYVATWGGNTIVKIGPYPATTRVWSYNLGTTSSAVAVDETGQLVYAMGSSGARVTVLNATAGQLVRTLTLAGAVDDQYSSLYGGLVVARGKLFHADASRQAVFRYRVADGQYDGYWFALPVAPYNNAFDGQSLCVSANNQDVRCFPLFDSSVFERTYSVTLAPAGGILAGSKVLSPEQRLRLSEALRAQGGGGYLWRPCYRGTEHGWSASTFHARCNGLSSTIAVMRDTSSGRIFGGFTDQPWSSSSTYSNTPNAWLYRFTGPDSATLERTTSVNAQYAMYSRSNYCPTFGNGHDLHLDNSCRSGYTSANAYSAPGYNNNWLAGCYNCWQLDELEVFYQTDERSGPCALVQCPSTDPCQVDGYCLNGECVFAPAAFGTPCDDNNTDTFMDMCNEVGLCVGVEPTMSTADPAMLLPDLHPHVSYAVAVRAATAVGPGPMSAPVTVTLPEARLC